MTDGDGENPKLLRTQHRVAQHSGGLARWWKNVIKPIDCDNIFLKVHTNIQ